MSYEVTASRKRPRGFESLVGQEFVVSTLSSAIESDRIAHAYLFSGPRGVGKTSAARLLAKALNCEQGPTAHPCGSCSNCQEITKGNSLDVIEIDGASNTSVNDVREIKDEVLFAPNSGRYKVYIIDEVHMLSNSAFNALLKTIEEPPPYIVFIFATTEIHKVPATIRSRCQQFNFRLIGADQIREKLAEAASEMGIEAEEEALFWIAKEATGSLRDAYTLFDQVASFSRNGINLEKIRKKLGLVGLERINELAEALASEDAGSAIEIASGILADGVAVEQFIIDLSEYFRNLLFIHHGIKKEAVLGYQVQRFSEQARSCWSVSQLETAIELLLGLYREIRYSLNQRFELELVLSRLAGMKSYLSPREILQQINGLKSELIRGDLPITVSEETEETAPEPPSEPTRPNGAAEIPEQPEEEQKLTPASEPEAEAIPSTQETVRGNIDQETATALIDSLRKTKPALVSALEKTNQWELEGDELHLNFDSGFTVNFVRGEVQTIAEAALPFLGFRPSIKLDVSSKKKELSSSEDEEVKLVKEIFRGEVVGPKGESS